MNHRIPKRIPAVIGPTASGKSDVALTLCRNFNGEIISSDSVQIYKYLNILSAKPSPEVLAEIPHHLIDFLDPAEKYNAGRFRRDAISITKSLISQGKLPVIVGGTPLYVRAFFHGLVPEKEISREVESRVNEAYEGQGLAFCYSWLQKADPDIAGRLNPNDMQRILRALKVALSDNEPLSELQKEHSFGDRDYTPQYIRIPMDRALLYERINKRVDKMMEEGGVEEVRDLIKKGYSPDCHGLKNIGYREVVAYLSGAGSRENMVNEIAKFTRRYAKRQLTWYRKYTDVYEWSPELSTEENLGNVASLIYD